MGKCGFGLLLLGLLSATAWSQGIAPSVMVFASAEGGSGSDNVADYLSGQIMKGLRDQYPCIDLLSDKGIADLLDFERQRQLLGAGDDSLLPNLAGSLGVQYIISVSVTAFGNQMSLSVSEINVASRQAVERSSKVTGQGDAALDGAESLANEFVGKLSNFKGQCDPHWTGSITYKEQQDAKSSTSDSHTGGRAANGQRDQSQSTATYSWMLEDVVEAVLMPVSLGSQGPNRPMAKFTHSFRNQQNNKTVSSGTMWCRLPGSNPKLIGYSDESGETYDALGEKSWKHPVSIRVSKDGNYEIDVRWEDVPLTWKRSNKLPGTGCPLIGGAEATTTGQDTREGREYTIRGKVDPKDADTLTGREERNLDLSTLPAPGKGAITVSWNLKLVKPKAKK